MCENCQLQKNRSSHNNRHLQEASSFAGGIVPSARIVILCMRVAVCRTIALSARIAVCESHHRLREASFQARESSFYARELLVSEIWITWDLCKAVFEWKFVALFFLFFLFFFQRNFIPSDRTRKEKNLRHQLHENRRLREPSFQARESSLYE